MLRDIDLYDESIILPMPILPPHSIDKGDIIENPIEFDVEQPMVNIEDVTIKLRRS